MIAWIVSAAIALWLYATCLFLIAHWFDDYSIADIGWGGGFVLLTIISFMQGYSISSRSVLASLCVFIWAARLTLHILARHKGEDKRYTRLREQWRTFVWLKAYFYVFIVQALLMCVIVSPVVLINMTQNQTSLNVLDALGLLLWSIGFFFEAVGDWQLDSFLAKLENKGRIMKYGLWRYTRHPNYFGESMMWWGLWVMALNVPFGWLTIVGPLTITILLVYISGIPLVEKQFKDNSEFQQYKRETSTFFPWFIKEG